MPRVSVIMSTYNEKLEYLTAAIDSVLKQTFQDYEFIIVLDNPKNKAIHDCVYNYAEKDGRIVVVENECNLGLTKSLNKAIQIAKGIYMSRMDADDIMIETCLERELNEIDKYNLDFVSASKINIDEQGKKIGTYRNDISPRQMQRLLPYDNSVNHSTVMVKMDIVRRERGYREIPSCEDYDLWLRILFHGFRMRIMPEVFLLYRIRENGICGNNSYQLYLSKRFLLKICRQARKDRTVLEDDHAYERFIKGQNTSKKKAAQFNQAYKQMYRGFEYLNQKGFRKGISMIIRAIHTDKEILWILRNKLSYQIRKRAVMKFVKGIA